MDNSAERKTGAVLSYVSIIVSTVIQLVYTPLLIRMLGQSDYGLYSLINSIIGYLTVLDLGFGNAIVVYTAKYRAQGKKEEEQKLHGMFKVVFSIIGIIAVIIGFVLFLNINNIFSNSMTEVELHKSKIMMLILIFNLALTFTFSIYQSIITAYEKFTFQKVAAILNSILKPIFMIPLLFLGYKSVAMCVVLTIVNIIILLSNYFYCKKKIKISIKFMGIDKKILKTILGYSIWIFIGTIVDKVNWSVDHFVLGAVSGTTAVSIYSVASQVNILFINLSTAISNVMLPKISKMVAKNVSNDVLTEEFIKVGRIQYYVIFLMASGLTLFGKEFLLWWAGKDYGQSYYVMLILIIPICIPLIQNLGLSILQAKNKFKFKAISTLIMAIFNIFISIYLAKKFGPIGSAIGTAIALIICNIILINIYYYKIIKIDVIKFFKSILKMTICFILPIISIILIMNIVKLNGIISVLIYGSIYTIIYICVCYCYVFNDYEKKLIDKVLNKVLRRRKHE